MTTLPSLITTDYSKYTNNLKSNASIITNPSKAGCSRNSEFLFSILKKYLVASEEVFEIGSGTGDHSVYFCERLPNVTWQTSDIPFYHDQIRATLQNAGFPNKIVREPCTFDIDTDEIPRSYDVIFASLLLHCIPEETTELLFRKVSTALKVNGLLIIYGPFKRGDLTTEGNKKFDKRLKDDQDERLGVKEMSVIKQLAESNHLVFVAEHLYEAVNNYVVVFKKIVASAGFFFQ